eukprot:Skav215749  [mRNA]  locus=scaffold106:165208:167174:+ [translate_table: standard]
MTVGVRQSGGVVGRQEMSRKELSLPTVGLKLGVWAGSHFSDCKADGLNSSEQLQLCKDSHFQLQRPGYLPDLAAAHVRCELYPEGLPPEGISRGGQQVRQGPDVRAELMKQGEAGRCGGHDRHGTMEIRCRTHFASFCLVIEVVAGANPGKAEASVRGELVL